MREEQPQPTLGELWSLVREQRKQMAVRAAELAALEVAEFRKAAVHAAEVARELEDIAKQAHLVRLNEDIKRFTFLAERSAEAADELLHGIEGARLAPSQSTGAAGAWEVIGPQGGDAAAEEETPRGVPRRRRRTEPTQ